MINRPTASNYNALETNRKTLSTKADSVFAYQTLDPYSIALRKLKREKNENLDMTLWQQAADKGELDQYINLLMQNSKKSTKLSELKDSYGDLIDYDTAMLALSYDSVADDVKEDRYDSDGNLIGNFSQKELIDKVLTDQALRLDAQILEDAKRSGDFWEKSWAYTKNVGINAATFVMDWTSGAVRVTADMSNTVFSTFYTIQQVIQGRATTFADISKAYARSASGQVTNDYSSLGVGNQAALQPNSPLEKTYDIAAEITQAAFELRRKYSYTVDATTGEYNNWGKLWHGMADSLGYMSLAMVGGGPAAMYLPMFTSNVRENVQMAGANPNYAKIMTNAATKAAVEYAVERVLGKVIGFTKLDKLIGFSDDALRISQQTVSKGLTATTKEALVQVSKQIGKDMLKEGIEEVLQEGSGMFIDYLYGDQYNTRAKENFTLENFSQAFLIGAATSLAIGSVSTMVTQRQVGVDSKGITYKMGTFQSVAYKQSVAAMNDWQKIATDSKADVNDRINAALKLEAVIATVGSLYESIGVENAVKAEKLLLEVQSYHDRKSIVKDKVQRGVYISDMLTNLDNEVGGKNWNTAFNSIALANLGLQAAMSDAKTQHKKANKSVAYTSFAKAMQNKTTATKLEESGVTTLETPVDTTAEVKVEPNTIFEIAQRLGFNVVVRTDGRDIIMEDDVIFIPADLQDADTQTLLKAVATQNTISNIIKNIPAALLVNVVDHYSRVIGSAASHYAEGELERQAIAALMFDKNFQLKMLLRAQSEKDTWGTDQVIDFIRNLKRMVAKTYTASTTEVTASGKPKRVLSDISKNITERVVKSLQDTLTVFNMTIASDTIYDNNSKETVVDKTLVDAIGNENATMIAQSPNNRYSAILNAAKNQQLIITDEVSHFMKQVAELMFNGSAKSNLLRAAVIKTAKLKDTANVEALHSAMLTTLSNGTTTERTDLVSAITTAYTSETSKNKLYYIAKTKSTERLFIAADKIVADIEKTLLGGQSINSVIKGEADLALIATELLASADDFKTNETSRFILLDHLIKSKSDSQFAILPDGTLIHLNYSSDNLVDVLKNAKSAKELISALEVMRDNKPDNILRLQDFFKIDLGKIGKTIVALTVDSKYMSGYQTATSDSILLQLNVNETSYTNLALIFHEMIHASNAIVHDDYRYRMFGGGEENLASELTPNKYFSKKDQIDLLEYVTTNFPLTTSIITKSFNTADFLGKVIYYLAREENSARSIKELYAYSALGFHYKVKNNDIYLTSPDGTRSWKVDELAPITPASLETMQNLLTSVTHASSTLDAALLLALAQSDSIAQLQDAVRLIAIPAIETGAETRYAYNELRDLLLNDLKAAFPNVNIDKIADILKIKATDTADFKTGKVLLSLNANESVKISEKRSLRLVTDLNKIKKQLGELSLKATLDNDYDLANAINQAKTDFVASILEPIKAEAVAIQLINIAFNKYTFAGTNASIGVTSPGNESAVVPTSFDFGDYSFTKHTGRSYMLTQRVGNKFITQEVDINTLLPLRPGQKPLLTDETMRKRFLFVIAKKTEAAKKTKTEPTLPEPEKNSKSATKPADKKTVFEWGDWTVKEFDDTHYVVSKNVDKTGYEQSDDDRADENYNSIQVVSKKTLLPDAMLGATGKPLLSSSERTKLLDWIEHETHPLIYKLRTDDPTKKDRIIYVANLTKAEEVFANLKKNSKSATPSSLSITDPSFEKLALYLATKATPSLQNIVLNHINTLEIVYIMTKYEDVPIDRAINLYVIRYFNSVQGKALLKTLPQAKELLTDQLTTSSNALTNNLNRSDKLQKQFNELLSDYYNDIIEDFTYEAGLSANKKLTKPELKEAKAELLELKSNDFKPFETTEFMNKYIDKMVAEIESDIDPDTWNVKVVPTIETTRLLLDVLRIRQLTTKETSRLMGVKDIDFDNMAKGLSKTALLHLSGDSIVVPVLQNIFTNLTKQKFITKPIRLIEFFAGYGSQNLALKYNNANYTSWKIAEWAIPSIQAYKNVHHQVDNTDYSAELSKDDLVKYFTKVGISRDYNKPLTNIELNRLSETKLRAIYNNAKASNNLINITNIKGSDLDIQDRSQYDYVLTYSFPCQDLSSAGKGAGMSDTSTRSGLLWEVGRILAQLAKSKKLPNVLIMENVPQIHNKKNIADFNRWQAMLAELGYTNTWADLRADNFDIPQTRVRTFMVSTLSKKAFTFDKGKPTTKTMRDFLEPEVDKNYYLKTYNWPIRSKINEVFEIPPKINKVTGLPSKPYNISQKNLINKNKASTILTSQSKKPGYSNLISDQVSDNFDLSTYLKPRTQAEYDALVALFKAQGKLPPLPEDLASTEELVDTVGNEAKPLEFPKVPKRVYISNERAKKSNLVHFIRKGRSIQLHSAVAAFVEGTTADFDKLSQFFKVRIKPKKGVAKLTYHDILEYVHNTSSMNEYTWKALAKYVYNNEVLANWNWNSIKLLTERVTLEKLVIITRLLEDSPEVNITQTYGSLKKMMTDLHTSIKTNDPTFIKKYNEVRQSVDTMWYYDEKGKKQTDDEWILDEKQLMPIFMQHFDGTLKSLNIIFSLAKTLSAHQQFISLSSNSGDTSSEDGGKTTKISSGNQAIEDNTAGVKTTNKSIWNWVANARRNDINYELTGYKPTGYLDSMVFEDLTPEDKYTILNTHFYNLALDYTRNPSQQEEYAAKIEADEAIEALSNTEVDDLVKSLLNQAREKVVVEKAKAEETTNDIGALKIAKDGLRNRARTLIRRLAGSKVLYNRLPEEVKALIEFTPISAKVLPEAYTDMSEAEILALSKLVADEIEKLKIAQQQARDLEKTKAMIARKVQTLQNKERKLVEEKARVKAREKAIKEGKTLKEKIDLKYNTKIAKQPFTITGPSLINDKLQAILNRVWEKTTESKVKSMEDSVQTIQNVHTAEEFYKAHAAELSAMTLSEIEDITDWLINAYLNSSDSVATQTFEATRFFILSYIYNESDTGKLFNSMNANLKLQLTNYLKSTITSAGTLLSLSRQIKAKVNPTTLIAVELFNQWGYEIPEAQLEALAKASSSGKMTDIVTILREITETAATDFVPKKTSTLRKIAGIRSMSMTSSPMTWVRNIISNAVLGGVDITINNKTMHIIGLEDLSTKVGNMVFKKDAPATELTPAQYQLTGKITPEIQKFITEQFIESGFFDATIDQISKYNPSQTLRHKNVDESDIIENMIYKAIYNKFYTESMFDSKHLNNIHAWLMRRLSDNKVVRRDAAKFIGKLLAETGAHLDAEGNVKTTIDKDIMKVVANAFALATTRYMHSDNFFSHFERYLANHSEGSWALFKTIMPFATASWNWFKAAVRYNPVGLGRAIYKITHIEQEITKREIAWQKGNSQIDPALTEYLLKRDLGAGIIGTVAFGFGVILAALGYVSLEDDDWGTPKLVVGNLRIDISSIFGSSSVLAGMAFMQTLHSGDDFSSALDAMIDPLVDGFFFTDLLRMDANSPGGLFEWSTYQAQSVALSFMPSIVRYISGMTYTGTYKTNTMFERAVVRLPFLGQAFNVPKRTNIYTGDSDGTFWDIVHRALPYFEIVTKSVAQTTTEMYGLNKEELHGTYIINDVPFKTSAKETARINKLYGEANANDLTDFYANKKAYRVLTENNRYVTKYYSNMTPKEIENALDQIFSKNSTMAKISAWLTAGNSYYTNDRELFNKLRALGYTKVYIGNKGFTN